MPRQHAEQMLRINIFWLKNHGYFPKGGGWIGGNLSWSWGEEPSGSIGIRVTTGTENYARLNYTHTDSWSGEKSEMDYQVRLVTTPCRFGGKRYWFICPLVRNGISCNRRVGVLFGGKYFGCRHCYDLAYNAQFEGGRLRTSSICEPDVEKAYQLVKREYYRGKPTRKYKRYLRMNEKMDMSWLMMAARLDKRFGKFADLKR